MAKRILRELFPPELEEFRGELARDNAASLAVLLFMGFFFSFVLFLCQYVFKVRFFTHVRSLEYLLFFSIGAGLFIVNRKEIEAKGTFFLYICTAVLFLWSAYLSAGDESDYPAFLFLFFAVIIPLLIRGAFGYILLETLAFSAFFLFLDFRSRPAEIFRMDLIHLGMALFVSLYLSHRFIRERITILENSARAETKAEHDALTGLFNRRGGEQLIRTYVLNSIPGAFFMIDVDNFKHINDSYGHARGDEILKNIAWCLQKQFRESDVVMRYGGDEFIVYAVGMGDIRHVESRLEKLTEAFHDILLDEETKDHVTCSIGCQINLGSWPDYGTLVQAADRLLYIVKEKGRDGFRCSDADYSVRTQEKRLY